MQNDAQAYNMLKTIEQKKDEKVQQDYERFAKLVNSLQKTPDDGFFSHTISRRISIRHNCSNNKYEEGDFG